MPTIITPVIIMAILGGLFAFLLGVVSKLTYIPVDPKVKAIRDALPGANCGACGYPGCDGCAQAMANGEAPVTACVVGGEKCAEEVAEIVGGSAEGMQKMVASVQCQGDRDNTEEIFNYDGVNDCRIMMYSFGGCKSCSYGCLGCGSCKNVCDFGAIKMVNGLAVIDQEKCTSCMACINTCPKHIIKLVPYHAPAQVKCSNPEFGKDVKTACKVGCIGCSMCTRQAPEEFYMDGKLARVKYHEGFDMEKAKLAAEKCPAKCIVLDQNPDINATIPEEKETVNA